MSSPGRPADRVRSSPSRKRANGLHRGTQNDTKSAQLIEELSQLLLDDDRSFKKKLDEESQSQQRRHVEALERALAQHEAVRRSAEHTFEAIQLEVERQKLAREAEERRRVEEQRRKLLEEQEAQRRREEEQRRREEEERQRNKQLELERKAAAEREAARKREEDDARAREKAAQDQAVRDKEEVERMSREESAARGAQQQPQPQPQQQQQQQQQRQAQSINSPARSGGPLDISTGPTAVSTLSNANPTALVSTYGDRMKVHQAYLKVHQRLKELRREVDSLKNANDPAKKEIYTKLREVKAKITMTLGQLLKGEENKKKNMDKIRLIKEMWQGAQSFFPSEVIDINEVRVEPVPTTMVIKGFVYIVSHTAKAIIRQMTKDAATDPAFADIIGVFTAQVFSGTTQLSGGHPMSDVLLAKFNKVHPVLFGKLGSEQGKAGLRELGWDTDQYGKEEAFPRFLGMSRCFAAITLRDFSRAKTQVNPFPNRLYWETVARLLNTPTKDQLAIQYLCLQGLLEPEFTEKFIRHYGNMALAVLRVAVKDFPARRPENNTINQQANTLMSYHDRYELELNLHL